MKYLCTVCGYVYDPATGDPDSGIAPGTAFEDIPDSWVCPVCGVGKDSFVLPKKWSIPLDILAGQPFAPTYAPARPGDIRESQADASLARRVLGWAPAHTFADGLAATFEWFRAHA